MVNDLLGTAPLPHSPSVSVGTVITALLFLFGPFLESVLRAGEERIEETSREVGSMGKNERTAYLSIMRRILAANSVLFQ